ncbi:MAG TPA: response regulator [Polyangiaceae bacterium]|nr:response regulator [Polyangiaceae bacterium]
MADADVKGEPPKALGRIALLRRPAAQVVRPRDPVARHAQLVALSERYGVPALDLDQICVKTEDLGNVPASLARHHLLIPVLAREDRPFVAMKDPSQPEVIQEVEFVAGKRVYAYAAPPEDIAEAIERAYLARERGALHYVGPDCPPETLRKAGLLPEQEAERQQQVVPPAPDVLLLEDSPAPIELSLATETLATGRGSAPPVTVSAYPPRLSSLPPALRGRASDLAEEGDVLSAVEEAFDELLEDTSQVAPLPRDPAEDGTPQPIQILAVDDDAESRSVLESVLTEAGYRVRSADNGRQALRMIKERAPDLLLLAAILPEVHGFEIARRLRGSQRYGSLRIVMLSPVHRGWRLAEDLRDSCGVHHYVEKPLRAEDLLRAVTAALSEETRAVEGAFDAQGGAERALEEGIVAYRKGDVAAAIAHLERGVAIDPLAYRIHFHLGLLFAQQGQTYDAIRALERAVEINSRHFAGMKNLAIMYCQAGFRNKAVETWTRALQLVPDEETRRAITEHMAALLSQEGLS